MTQAAAPGCHDGGVFRHVPVLQSLAEQCAPSASGCKCNGDCCGKGVCGCCSDGDHLRWRLLRLWAGKQHSGGCGNRDRTGSGGCGRQSKLLWQQRPSYQPGEGVCTGHQDSLRQRPTNSQACAGGGGSAQAISSAVSQAVATATAKAYANALATIFACRGGAANSGSGASGNTGGGGSSGGGGGASGSGGAMGGGGFGVARVNTPFVCIPPVTGDCCGTGKSLCACTGQLCWMQVSAGQYAVRGLDGRPAGAVCNADAGRRASGEG